jgi:2-polyprenyl-6-hydroxyphenyl methylase/3-demethylubiquinone-9 3-methyltransferase
MNTTKIESEVKKFSDMAKDWWDMSGKFKILHRFNGARIDFIKDCLVEFNIPYPADILDIGCGGGLLCEPFAKLGHNLTGLDASLSTIDVAKTHSKSEKLDINYIHGTAEEYLANNPNKKFDVIFAMEIIEHINSPIDFIKTIQQFLKPSGLLFISTINRNLKSLLLAKFSAEYILNWLPKGTHSYDKFITPSELNNYLTQHSLLLSKINGINFNILTQSWNLHKNPEVNYILCAKNSNN